MRRKVLVLSLLATLAVAPAARAGLSDWNGEIAEGGFMAFNEKTKKGKVVKAVGFDWSTGVPITCEEGDFEIAGSVAGMKVRNRKFKRTEDEGSYTEKVKGRILRGGKAKGTIRVKGDIDGHTGCNTGKLHWTAEHI